MESIFGTLKKISDLLWCTASCKQLSANFKTAFSLLLYSLLLFSQLTHAQLYPVQVNESIIPPYNTTLNSYATASSVKLRLYLTMTDVNISNRQVRLKLKIKGQGLNIQSTDFVMGAPFIYLNGGSQQQFTNIDLAPYFQLSNLLGINPQQYNQSLPEGIYKICWEVYDFLTGQLISNPNMGCDTIYLLLNDPPFLNLPNRGDQLTDAQPTNIIFQWTPRHANATNVSYEFELRELWDNQIDPQAGFLTSPPYHKETTYATTLLYTISKPTLLPGHTYAWRVRAKSTTGLSENAVFKNSGYSEIFYFTYTNTCYPPTFTLAEPLNTGRVKISWQTQPDHNKYHVQYKRADVPDAEWFEVFSYSNQAQISNLQEGVTYNFRVGGTCNALIDFDQAYSYSTVNQFTMPTKDDTVSYSCGIVPEIEITNTDPLLNIGVNETFTAGDFPVTVKQIEGSNGNYSGTGYIVVPYLADTKIAVEFSGIRINTDYQLFDGIIQTTYDATWSSVSDADDLFNGNPGQQNTRTVDFIIQEITIDPNGDILVVGVGGQPVVEYAGGEDYVITDQGDPNADPPVPPKVYHVDEAGNITPLGEQAAGGASTAENTHGVNTKGEATNLTAKGVEVTFAPSMPNASLPTVYGFDAYNPSYPETEALYKKLGSNYYLAYKAVPQEKSDYIVANIHITNDSIQLEDIIFKTKDGVAIEKVASRATTVTLKLTGVATDADVETQAVIKQGDTYQIAGAFIQYQAKPKNVEIVLVNTADGIKTQDVKDKLIAIYKQAMVSLSITEINDFKTDLNSLAPSTIESGESGFLANYTQQQQNINAKLKARPDYNQTAYYLILTDKKPSTSGEKGLMPLGRQFGYIYTSNASPSGAGGISAHELGHGAFQLKHPFSTHSYGFKNSTDWLMDYADGEQIPYAHWKDIHNQSLRIGIFDGDKEGEYTDGLYFEKLLQQIRCAYINGENTIPFPEKYINKAKDGVVFKFTYGLPVDKGVINGEKISLASIITQNKKIISNITSPKFINKSQIEFDGLTIKFTTPSYSLNNGMTPFEHLTEYLFPKNEEIVKQEYSEVLDQLLKNETITDEDIVALKRIASCGSNYFSTKNKYLIISKIANHSFALTEYYEDLILDLIETHPKDVTSYSNELLGYLNNDYKLLRKLFNEVDDVNAAVFWKGNENNFTRFLGVLYGLWEESKYAQKSNYTYVDVGDYFDASLLSPELISYNGKSWFPNVSYTNEAFFKGKFTMTSKTITTGNFCRLEYEYFQPVFIAFIEVGNRGKFTKVPVPAIYFAGTVKKDNLEKSLSQLNLTVDIALTLSAIGNLTKLKYLTQLQKIGRVTLASVEITSGFADIMVRYTDLCEGNESFCTAFQKYNTYLQLGLLGSGLIRAKFKTIRNTAEEEYLKHRKNLVKIHGESDVRIKELDLHFGVVNGAGNWTIFFKIKMKISTIDADGWLMGKYVNGELEVIGNTNVAQKWDYIVKADGQILVGRKHSWLSQGEDVLAAGELKYNNGKLVEISNASGHYEPTVTEASNFLRIFRQAGVKVDDATLTILDKNGNIFKQVSPTAGDRLTYY